LRFAFNISATAETSDFEFYFQLRLIKVHDKNHTQKKSERGPRLGNSPKFGGSPLIFLQQLKLAASKLVGFAKAHHKTTPIRKNGRGPNPGRFPKFWGSSVIFRQRVKIGIQLRFSVATCVSMMIFYD